MVSVESCISTLRNFQGRLSLHFQALHTLMSVRDPGARTNWLSLPRSDLMKVCDSVMSISPALLISNLAQVLGKNSAIYASILASDTCLVTSKTSAAAF